MKVSVALATYNGAEYLQDQLDSFVGQRRRPDELIACDDASTDGTVELLEAFADVAPFAVRIHRNPANVGFVRNFNTALSLCTGDVILLSDHDDVWFPEKIAVVLSTMREHPDKLLFINDARVVREDLAETGLTTFGQVRAEGGSDRSLTQGCCFAIRRELLEWALPIPDTYPYHDMWIAELAHDLGVAYIIESPLQLFRRHATNASPATGAGTTGIRGSISRVRAHAHADTRSVLNNRASMIRARLERLKAWSVAASFGDGTMRLRVAGSIRGLENSLKAIDARRGVLNRPRSLRTIGVLKMLVSGQYAHFSGVRSALLDTVLK